MSDDLTRITCLLGGWLRAGRELLLMTDYDGALTPIVSDPIGARLATGVRADLLTLAESRHIRLAIISGRDLADLRARVAVPGAIYAGCHGLEVDGPGLTFTHPEAEAQQDSLRAVSLALCLGAPFVDGMRVEPKRLGVAIHYRDVAASEHRNMETMVARSLRRCGRPFKVVYGRKVIEVLPHVAWDKGRCARWICARVADTRPGPTIGLYVGDDWTDEQAFEALRGEALTVKVGSDPPSTRATYRLAGVGEVHRLLSTLAALRRRRPASAQGRAMPARTGRARKAVVTREELPDVR